MEKTYKNLKRVRGVDGRKLRRSRRMNQYEIACLQSHIKAIRQAFKDGAKEALIMEDDIFIDHKDLWVKNIRQVIKGRPRNADCIILHCSNMNACRKMSRMKKDYSRWRVGSRRYSTGCYYITRKGMKKICSRFKNNFVPHGKDPADKLLYRILISYNYTKPLFNMRPNRSLVVNRVRVKRGRVNAEKKIFHKHFDKVKKNKQTKPQPKPKSQQKPKPQQNQKPQPKPKQKKEIILKTRLKRRVRRLTARLRRVKNRGTKIRIMNRLRSIRRRLS